MKHGLEPAAHRVFPPKVPGTCIDKPGMSIWGSSSTFPQMINSLMPQISENLHLVLVRMLESDEAVMGHTVGSDMA